MGANPPVIELERPKATILIVDDEPHNRFAFSEVLEELEENLVLASSGAEALRFLLARECAVILLDVSMPEMDGYETAALIRQRSKLRHVPIIFVSAVHKEDDHITRAYGLGAVDYVFKPVAPVVLKSKVAVFVELYKKTAEVERKAELERQLQDENLKVRTEKLEAERALRIAEQQLFQSQKMEAVGQLTGGIAHDFNNMLTVVIGNLDALARALKDSGRNFNRTQMALTGALSCAELTRRLLAFARRQPLEPKALDLGGLAGNVVKLLGRTLGEKIDIRLGIDDNLWSSMADPAQVESALMNLAVNARDAMPEGGTLNVEVRNSVLDTAFCEQNPDAPRGEFVMLMVSDTGAGMSPDVVERAFEPFFTTKRVGLGSGLGLSMVYGFVKQSGGYVRIESTPSKGTCVRLYLPKTDAPAEVLDMNQLDASLDEISGLGRTVLLVEDDAGVRAVTATLMRELHFKVLEADSGASALRVLEEEHDPIDLLFTDIVMPGGISGFELARLARDRRPGLKILYTSGYSASMRLGAEFGELLPKPYRQTDLMTKLRNLFPRETLLEDGRDEAVIPLDTPDRNAVT